MSRRQRRRPARSGVSLVENLIGFLLLSSFLMPWMGVMSTGIQTVTATQDHLTAVLLAQRIQELARTCDYQKLALYQAKDGTAARQTLEWDLTTDGKGGLDRIPVTEKIRGTTFRIAGLKLEAVGPRENGQPLVRPLLMVISFAIEFQNAQGRKQTFLASCARSPQG